MGGEDNMGWLVDSMGGGDSMGWLVDSYWCFITGVL